jgi:hypothetical protein
MPPKTAVPYKKPWVAILIFASDSGTMFPSKNACFERSTSTPPKIGNWTSSYRGIIPDSVWLMIYTNSEVRIFDGIHSV